MPTWPWWDKRGSTPDNRIRELLRGIWDLHASYGDAPWLWRGQANSRFALEPAMHTRVRRNEGSVTDPHIQEYTRGLMRAARRAALDQHEGTRLPDMALLAALQHHGAATPLLDVSLDPIVGLYMAVVSPNRDDLDQNGVLFAIKRPDVEVRDFDSRRFDEIYGSLGGSIVLYSAPDVSERLRIQRGHFLLGPFSDADERVTIPLSLDGTEPDKTWLAKRVAQRGKAGQPAKATSDIAVFRIAASLKEPLQKWLQARSGLTPDFVYPTAWHQPHLDRFALSHSRLAAF